MQCNECCASSIIKKLKNMRPCCIFTGKKSHIEKLNLSKVIDIQARAHYTLAMRHRVAPGTALTIFACADNLFKFLRTVGRCNTRSLSDFIYRLRHTTTTWTRALKMTGRGTRPVENRVGTYTYEAHSLTTTRRYDNNTIKRREHYN